MTREETVYAYLREHGIEYTCYNHPEGKTIDEAKRWWHDDGSVHCKNIFMRNHKGNQHYLICFPCDKELDIHDLEARLKASLQAQGLPSCGKLSFASAERMMKYLGVRPGSVSLFTLVNDANHEVTLFVDRQLLNAEKVSFHPNDNRASLVITRDDMLRFIREVGNPYEVVDLYDPNC